MTLIDGEMIIDTIPDAGLKRRYLAYDLMAINSCSKIKVSGTAYFLELVLRLMLPSQLLLSFWCYASFFHLFLGLTKIHNLILHIFNNLYFRVAYSVILLWFFYHWFVSNNIVSWYLLVSFAFLTTFSWPFFFVKYACGPVFLTSWPS